MSSESLTVRIDSQTKEALDAIASVNDRNRTYIVKEALRVYLELYQWHVERIRQGLRKAESSRRMRR